jgi:hypothetical protein
MPNLLVNLTLAPNGTPTLVPYGQADFGMGSQSRRTVSSRRDVVLTTHSAWLYSASAN